MNSPVSEGATTTLHDLGVVLNDVNKIRLAVGIGEGKLPELPKGIKGDPRQCVLAKALSNGWNVEVDGNICLRHTDDFVKPFNWERATDTLRELGFRTELYYDGEEFDDYVVDFHDESDQLYDDLFEIMITCTPEMENLIHEFDDGLIPHLVLND